MTSVQRDALVEVAASFGWDDFRPGQREAMEAAVEGHDVLVMASGHGKSAIYEAPAMVRSGTALVVSPLIALQCDHVERINSSLGERTAVMVNSALKASEVDDTWEAAGSTAKFLFLAPEQLANEEVLDRLGHPPLVALTATAPTLVQREIIDVLHMR